MLPILVGELRIRARNNTRFMSAPARTPENVLPSPLQFSRLFIALPVPSSVARESHIAWHTAPSPLPTVHRKFTEYCAFCR